MGAAVVGGAGVVGGAEVSGARGSSVCGTGAGRPTRASSAPLRAPAATSPAPSTTATRTATMTGARSGREGRTEGSGRRGTTGPGYRRTSNSGRRVRVFRDRRLTYPEVAVHYHLAIGRRGRPEQQLPPPGIAFVVASPTSSTSSRYLPRRPRRPLRRHRACHDHFPLKGRDHRPPFHLGTLGPAATGAPPWATTPTRASTRVMSRSQPTTSRSTFIGRTLSLLRDENQARHVRDRVAPSGCGRACARLAGQLACWKTDNLPDMTRGRASGRDPGRRPCPSRVFRLWEADYRVRPLVRGPRLDDVDLVAS